MGGDGPGYDDISDCYDGRIDCPECGGEGFDDNECECESIVDTCCCAELTPRVCRACRGRGWVVEGQA